MLPEYKEIISRGVYKESTQIITSGKIENDQSHRPPISQNSNKCLLKVPIGKL